MHDMITIGSGTVDIFMKSPQFHLQPAVQGVLLCEEYGGKLDIDEFEIQSGGAGTNTAVGFTRMGFKTAAVVEIGKDTFGQIVWDELKREHVDTEYVITEKSERTAVSVLLISQEGGRSALTYRGASAQLEARDLPWEALKHTRWVHLSNISGNKELLLRLFDHLHQGSSGLSWNPGKKELQLLAERQLSIEHIPCDIFIVNKEEWSLITEVQTEMRQHIPLIVITDGKRGGVVYTKGEYEFSYTVEPIQVSQETGAGDAFIIGFVSAHLLSLPLPECCEWGKRNSASVVKKMGAKTGLLTRRDIATMK